MLKKTVNKIILTNFGNAQRKAKKCTTWKNLCFWGGESKVKRSFRGTEVKNIIDIEQGRWKLHIQRINNSKLRVKNKRVLWTDRGFKEIEPTGSRVKYSASVFKSISEHSAQQTVLFQLITILIALLNPVKL
jgi:hypothetical protein